MSPPATPMVNTARVYFLRPGSVRRLDGGDPQAMKEEIHLEPSAMPLLANFVTKRLRRTERAREAGNDDNYVDWILPNGPKCRKVQDATRPSATAPASSPTTRQSACELTNTTPNGRLAWMPLSDGISPAQPGADKQGPTAIIKSVNRWCGNHEHRHGAQLQILKKTAGFLENAMNSLPCCVPPRSRQ